MVAKDKHSLWTFFSAQDGFRTHQTRSLLSGRHIHEIHSHSMQLTLRMKKVDKFHILLFDYLYCSSNTSITYRSSACPWSPAQDGFIL